MIFTVKMEDFRRMCRYVAGGHMTEARETVRVVLNNLEVKARDMIQNAYLTVPVTEKIWIT